MSGRPPEEETDDVDGSDVTYKVLLLGDSGVGKTSLIRTLTGKPFSHSMLTTVGIDFVKKVFIVDGARTCLQIWDTAGQERFRSITRFQYRGTKGLLLVYDITNRNSFDMLDYWLESIRNEIDASNKEPIPVIIVGNKCDLIRERVVKYDEGHLVALSDFQTGFWETSAVTGENVRDCFEQLAHAITDLNNPHLMKTYRHSKTSNISAAEQRSSTDPVSLNNTLNDTRSSTNSCRNLTKLKSSKSPTCSCSH